MENDKQTPYSVLTKNDVTEMMKKQILELSEVLLLSKSDATVLLMYQRWGTHWISDFLGEKKEKLLTESGLKSVDSNQDSSEVSCGICSKIGDKFYELDGDDKKDEGDVVDDDLIISTPFCSHKFCVICWRNYLEKNFYFVEKTLTSITCPHEDCQAAVGPETIEKLTKDDQEMYEKYVMRSYIDGNLDLKKCPEPDCNYVIEFSEEYEDDDDDESSSLNMVCLCGHIFCWRCMLESHRPVTCINASDWFSRDLNKASDEALSLSWIENNTKTCPRCLSHVVLDGVVQRGHFLTCTCSFTFCWICLQSEEFHTSRWYKECPEPTLKRKAQKEISCFDRWQECWISVEEAKSNLQALVVEEESNMDTESLKKGLMLLVQCRQVLKWTCVYEYMHTEFESSKREYLRFLLGQASDQVESLSKTLKKETERALYELRFALYIDTSSIGNYFYHFIKALQDGLDDVKVKSYNDYGGPYWSCDGCNSGNSWAHKECKTCSDANASTKEKCD